jgi:hypothetical protein
MSQNLTFYTDFCLADIVVKRYNTTIQQNNIKSQSTWFMEGTEG